MSKREKLIYEKMKLAGETEPYETVFFFPTEEDAAKARKWLRTKLPSGKLIRDLPPTSEMSTAFRLVAERVGVPVRYLEIVRGIEERIKKIEAEQEQGRD